MLWGGYYCGVGDILFFLGVVYCGLLWIGAPAKRYPVSNRFRPEFDRIYIAPQIGEAECTSTLLLVSSLTHPPWGDGFEHFFYSWWGGCVGGWVGWCGVVWCGVV